VYGDDGPINWIVPGPRSRLGFLPRNRRTRGTCISDWRDHCAGAGDLQRTGGQCGQAGCAGSRRCGPRRKTQVAFLRSTDHRKVDSERGGREVLKIEIVGADICQGKRRARSVCLACLAWRVRLARRRTLTTDDSASEASHCEPLGRHNPGRSCQSFFASHPGSQSITEHRAAGCFLIACERVAKCEV